MVEKYTLMEWIDAEEMHRQTNRWLSEFLFIKDEQRFFNGLFTEYTSLILDNSLLDSSKKLAIGLLDLENELDILYKTLQVHRNRIEVIIDAIDQKELEKSYRKEHQYLDAKVESYLDRYRKIKKDIFAFITNLRNSQKNKRLLR